MGRSGDWAEAGNGAASVRARKSAETLNIGTTPMVRTLHWTVVDVEKSQVMQPKRLPGPETRLTMGIEIENGGSGSRPIPRLPIYPPTRRSVVSATQTESSLGERLTENPRQRLVRTRQGLLH